MANAHATYKLILKQVTVVRMREDGIEEVLGNCIFHKSGKNWSDVIGTGLRRLNLGYRGDGAGFPLRRNSRLL